MIASIELEQRAEADSLELLFRQSYPAVFFSLINAILICFILWDVQDPKILTGWLALIGLATVLRIFMFVRYHLVHPKNGELLRWKKPYLYSLLFSSLIWGIGSLVIMPQDSYVHQVIIFVFLIGMSGGAIAVYMADRRMTLMSISLVLLPVTLWFVLQGHHDFVAIALGAMLFYFATIRATAIISNTLRENFLLNEELARARDKAEKLANLDELTGIDNRRSFYESGHILSRLAQREKTCLGVILLDIDLFKDINDRFGHAGGDAALKTTTELIKNRLRKSDIFARIGGEEFAVLLPGSSLKQAAELAEELRRCIETTDIHFRETTFNITISFGVCSESGRLIIDIDNLVRKADMALYQAKREGRNRVICCTPSTDVAA